MALDSEKQDLFRKVRVKCGWPIRQFQLGDDEMCDLLEMCVGDYAEKVQNWIVENQWSSLYGKDITATDMAFALSVRTMDTTYDYADWFSKQVGLQQNGPWELKKDYITIEEGKQVYEIPKGREINKVLYLTPPTTQAALFANTAGIDIGFGGGYSQLGGSSYSGPLAGYYVMPASDTMYLAADMNLKQRLLRSDMVYKVTAGPNGTKLLHLLSTPGSKLTFSYMGSGASGIFGVAGMFVFYTYYDIDNQEDSLECSKLNPNVLLTPDQIPLDKMDYSLLNNPTKQIIRQLLTADYKITLGNVRGYASGKVSIPNAEMQLDYQILLQQGKDEHDRTIQALEDRLKRMNPEEQAEKLVRISDAQNKTLSSVPLGLFVI